MILWAFFAIASITKADIIIENMVYRIISEDERTCAVKGILGDRNSITSIEIPPSIEQNEKIYHVTRIGSSAFSNCTNLKTVTIPNGVINIDGKAFQECNNLTSITLPDGLTSIEAQTFLLCI